MSNAFFDEIMSTIIGGDFLDELTRKYLSENVEDPSQNLPEGCEYKFGIRGKFKKYASLEELEQCHIECSGGRTGPFAYTLIDWEGQKQKLIAKMEPNDEIWEDTHNNAFFIVRNNDLILKEYPAVKTFCGNTTVKLPDPAFIFDLYTL